MELSIIATTFVCFINFINSTLKKHSKIPVFLIIILMWVLMGANTQNPDIGLYSSDYNLQVQRAASEMGYTYFIKLFYLLGFDYIKFRMIFSFIGIILIHHTVKQFIHNSSAFYLLYFIYPFMMDVVQMRNFMAMAIFIYGIPYLLSENKKDTIKYILLILLASSIQLTAIVYLPICFVAKARKKIFLKFVICVSLISIVVIALDKSLLNEFSQFLLKFFGVYDDRVAIYAYVQTNNGFILFWFIQIMNFSLIYWSNNIFIPRSVNTFQTKPSTKGIYKKTLTLENRQQKFMVLMLWVNVYAFMFLPFYVFQSTFSRFMRNIVPLNLIAYIIVGQSLPPRSVKKWRFIAVCLIYNCFLFFIDVYNLYSKSIVAAIFKYNWIIK